MARNDSEKDPVLKCPHCSCEDTDEILFRQVVPATFYISVNGAGIEVDTQSIEMDVSDAMGDLLYCCKCCCTFEIPTEFDITYA